MYDLSVTNQLPDGETHFATLLKNREFLVFDGGFAGVFLGGAESWAFSSGVSWDACILREGGRYLDPEP